MDHLGNGELSPIVWAGWAAPAWSATIDVTNTNHSEAGSLREAITNANNGDTINITATGTIILAGALPRVEKNLTIQGPGVADVCRSALVAQAPMEDKPGVVR